MDVKKRPKYGRIPASMGDITWPGVSQQPLDEGPESLTTRSWPELAVSSRTKQHHSSSDSA